MSIFLVLIVRFDFVFVCLAVTVKKMEWSGVRE